MKVSYAVAVLSLLAAPAAYGQKQMPRYGEEDKDKSSGEIESEQKAEAAYRRSLSNVPDAGPTDPWGNVRGNTTKSETKTAPAKRVKPAAPTPQ